VGVANALRASLGFRYRAAWPIALPVVAAAFDRLGPAAGPILGGCLEALGEMGAHGEGLQCRGQLTLCLSAAVKALGPEQVLSVLPLRLEEGVDAEIAAIRNGRSNGFDRDGDDAMETDAPGAELDENGGNVAGAAGARLWLVPLLRQALRGETASHTTPFAWCTPFLKDFSRRHSSPALPFQCLTGKTFD
jgi:ribosomal RNA-processing protein 12